MTEIHEVVRVIEQLDDEDRALVLAFAELLLLRLPSSEPRDEAEWRAWVSRVQMRGSRVFAREMERLRAAGLADEKGPLPLLSLPEDMEPASDTSVET